MVAFELAKRLEEGGEEVAIVGGIDNPPDLASILGSTQHRILMIDMLPEVTTLTREEAQVFGAKTDHVSIFLSLSPAHGTLKLTTYLSCRTMISTRSSFL